MLVSELQGALRALGTESRSPAVRCNYGSGILPSLFGAEPFIMPYQQNTLPGLSSPGRADFTLPSYTPIFIRQVMEYADYSGDMAFVEEMFPTLLRICDVWASLMTEDDLIPLLDGQWNYYEWKPCMDGDTPVCGRIIYESPLNAFVSDAFHCFPCSVKERTVQSCPAAMRSCMSV